MSDRIVYGARCAWWGSIHDVAAKPSGLPCCPHCGGVLMEVGSEAEWWAGVDRSEQDGNPGYRAFIEWLRGQCFPTLEQAREFYDLVTE